MQTWLDALMIVNPHLVYSLKAEYKDVANAAAELIWIQALF